MCGDLPMDIDWDLQASMGDGFTTLEAMADVVKKWSFAPPPDPMDPEPGKHRWESYGR